MQTRKGIVIAACLAALVAPSMAQVRPSVTGGVWQIENSVDSGDLTWNASTLVFTAERRNGNGYEVEGYFDWVSSARHFGRELVKGRLEADGSLTLTGQIDESRPKSGIASSIYTARVDLDAKRITRGTWATGSPGQWEARRSDVVVTARAEDTAGSARSQPSTPSPVSPLAAPSRPAGPSSPVAPSGPAAGSIAVTAQASRCDQLAAHPLDSQKPPAVKGVPDEAVTAPAIEACALAVQQNPQSARLKFQLARALWTAKQYDEALEALLQAEELDYAPAYFYLGLAHEQGLIEGVQPDLAAASEMYLVAAAAGFAPAVDAYQGIDWDVSINFDAFAVPSFAEVIYENRFELLDNVPLEKRLPERRDLLFYILGVDDFIQLKPNEFDASCPGIADSTLNLEIRKLASDAMGFGFPPLTGDSVTDAFNRMNFVRSVPWDKLPELAQADANAGTSQQAGTDDMYAFVADYGGCTGEPVRRFYRNLAAFVRAGAGAVQR